jgi:hypothetical protein
MTRLAATIVAVLVCLAPARAEEPATLSFAAGRQGSQPNTVTADDRTIRVDLAALPRGTAVYRAVLRPGRDETWESGHRNRPTRVTAAGSDDALALLPPRFVGFDATAAVRRAVQAGSGQVAFTVVSLPGYLPGETRLDVTCAARVRDPIPAVKALRARHRDGQTFLTWAEPDSPLTADEVTFKDWHALQARLAKDARQVRFRIYRGGRRITAATVRDAELIDEVGPLTCWDADYYGNSPRDEDRLFRYAVEDGKGPVPVGTGVYVHNPRQAGKAYYAVSVAVNGAENLSAFTADNATQEPVEETVGQGVPVLQRTLTPREFNYVEGPTLHYYVRWEAPPNSNVPSRPFDYLVALPAKTHEPIPAGLHLHCWGANLNGGYGWWYNAAQGAMLISTNQVPYDWWTGYHEHLGTWQSWGDGVVRDYTQRRLLSFLDWAGTRWRIDRNRVFTAGASMGGSGSPNLGIRHADRVAWVLSWVGVHTPARSPQFRGSYEQVYGLLDWKVPYQDGKTPAFQYFDDTWFLREDPGRDTPLICFANGKNDDGIGWPQARDYWRALQETRRPHVFVWGQAGHGQRALLPGAHRSERELGIAVRLNQTLPAFTRCSLDNDPGSGDPKDGDAEGQSNLYLVWVPGTAVEEAGEWAMDLRLNEEAPGDRCTVDVTPRRCQKFRPAAGTKLAWTARTLSGGKEIGSGEVNVDRWALATVPGVPVSKDGCRLVLRPTR